MSESAVTQERKSGPPIGVDPAYRHSTKIYSPGKTLELPDAMFKWYSLAAADRPVPDTITALARAQLTDRPPAAHGLGFIILHRCGESFYFLLISTWRNENELWETVWYKDGAAMSQFEVFPREASHKPTFCVWELAPVWHEVGAWNRFLRSPRDDAAVRAWLSDQASGEA